MRVNRCDCSNALICDSDCDIVISFFSPSEHLLENSIAMLGSLLISLPQNLQNLQYLHLYPWSRHSVIVELLGQLVLDYLLENDNKASCEIFILPRVILDLLKVEVQSSSHHTRLSVAECFLHLLLIFWNISSSDQLDLLQNQNGFLSNEVCCMPQKLHYMLSDS